METAPSGAVRSVVYPKGPSGHPIRLDLLLTNDEALRRIGETFGEGNEKYGPDNWKKGFNESVYIGHAMEHILQHMAGDKSEDHLAHAAWNLMALMWVQKNRPDLLDISTLPEKFATLQKGFATPVNMDERFDPSLNTIPSELTEEAEKHGRFLLEGHLNRLTNDERLTAETARHCPSKLSKRAYNLIVSAVHRITAETTGTVQRKL